MRTATNVSKKSAPVSRAKLSKKATRPVSSKDTGTVSNAVSDGKTIVLKQICAEIGINPKVARRELRKVRKEAIASKEKSALRSHDLHTRWVFAKSDPQVAAIRKTLKDYVERNGKSK